MVAQFQYDTIHTIRSLPLAIGLFVSVSALVALCAKHARRYTRKSNHDTISKPIKLPHKSSLLSPRHMVSTISPFMNKESMNEEARAEIEVKIEEGGFGEGGLWQREILMGDKCKPPEFSGVIYYDSRGNQLPDFPPRSPRASPLPSYLMPPTR